ncbi:adenine deaminase [Thermodesulfomicrobium sp. WS]|uniref:adenine deaminase n=1 Tax=Thermodesulfomicrobium sp. WS TaxID=3004129 RepID=UPI0024923488|nr:adenine deaminase [Thermodesulfomicrobium sp. WS]BDV01780.1 adenine deaminase [Thermodesulfomicrobium sp. WS]
MHRHDRRRLSRIIHAAQGAAPADLCLRGCRIVNVFTGEIEAGDLAVAEGVFLGWGRSTEAREELDARGLYVAPGFLDAHIHLESTMLSPRQFCAASLPHGTTAVVADPHEIANVLGMDGVRYLLAATEGLPLEVFFMLPSCVPASHLERSGAELSGADLATVLDHPRVVGLGEMMNFPGVLGARPEILDKLVLFQDHPIDGHAPLLGGLGLSAYIAAGIGSDHECTSAAEAREKLAQGMALMLRHGSQSKDLTALAPAVTDHSWPWCMLATDDLHPHELCSQGHMDRAVNAAMAAGIAPARALALASITTARHFGLRRRGAIAPGYRADFSVSPTLHPWKPVMVFKDGRLVAQDGALVAPLALPPCPPLAPVMHLPELRMGDLAIPAQGTVVRAIGVLEGSLLTADLEVEARVENGCAVADPSRDLVKLAVYNRYGAGTAPALGFAQGLGLQRGAMGTTVAHDSHNLLVAGVDDASMLAVAQSLRDAGGGMAVAQSPHEVDVLPLPLAGLMSDAPAAEVAQTMERLTAAAHGLGCTLAQPFMALSFLALPVIPALKLTDMGLVETALFQTVPLFPGT